MRKKTIMNIMVVVDSEEEHITEVIEEDLEVVNITEEVIEEEVEVSEVEIEVEVDSMEDIEVVVDSEVIEAAAEEAAEAEEVSEEDTDERWLWLLFVAMSNIYLLLSIYA